jgi:hypothetical protein
MVSPTKLKMLSPSRREFDLFEDGVIEIPDSAGLSDATRNAIFEIWANQDDVDKENGFADRVHYVQVCGLLYLLTNRIVKPINIGNEI